VWAKVGGKTIGSADPQPTPKSTIERQKTDRTNVGILPLGKRRIVIFGALLPHPTDKFTHWFGLDSYTVSDGYQELFLRTLTWPAGSTSALPAGAALDFGIAALLTLRGRRRFRRRWQ
jgi:hypothetical protein